LWVTNGDRAHEGPPLPAEEGAALVARQRRLFEQACEVEGRDPSTVDTLVLTGPRLDSGLGSVEAFRTLVEAYAAVGVTDLVVPWPRKDPPYVGDESILDQITTT
jgi:hypothetical protein